MVLLILYLLNLYLIVFRRLKVLCMEAMVGWLSDWPLTYKPINQVTSPGGGVYPLYSAVLLGLTCRLCMRCHARCLMTGF